MPRHRIVSHGPRRVRSGVERVDPVRARSKREPSRPAVERAGRASRRRPAAAGCRARPSRAAAAGGGGRAAASSRRRAAAPGARLGPLARSDDGDPRRRDAESGGGWRPRPRPGPGSGRWPPADRPPGAARCRRRTGDEDHREPPPAGALEDRPPEIVRSLEEEERVGTQPPDGPANAPVASARGRQDRAFRKLRAEPVSRRRVARRQEQPVARVTDAQRVQERRDPPPKRAVAAPWTQMCGVPRDASRAGAVERLASRLDHIVDREPVEAIEVPERTVLARSRASRGGVGGASACAGRPARCGPRWSTRRAPRPGGRGRPRGEPGPESLPTNRLAAARIPMRPAEVGAPGEVDDCAAGSGVLADVAPSARSPAEPSRTHGCPSSRVESPAQRAEVAGRPALGASRAPRPARRRRRARRRVPRAGSSRRAASSISPVGATVARCGSSRPRMRGASPGGASAEAGQGGQVAAADRGGEPPVVRRSCACRAGPGEPGPGRSGALRARRARSRRGGESVREPSGSATPRALGKRTQRSKRRRRSRAGAQQRRRGAPACRTRQRPAGRCRRTPTSRPSGARARGIRTSSRACGEAFGDRADRRLGHDRIAERIRERGSGCDRAGDQSSPRPLPVRGCRTRD